MEDTSFGKAGCHFPKQTWKWIGAFFLTSTGKKTLGVEVTGPNFQRWLSHLKTIFGLKHIK